ncbi:MAG: hypothetical protein KJ000_29240 [Pirellulaceae bacterium]|nr:hypothetical protein [Pirellulaceae bacterium]
MATVEAGHRLPDDTEAAFRAFEDAVFPEDWNGRVLLVQQVRQQQTKFPSFPVHDPHELAYDPSRLAAVRKALERIAGPPAAKSPAPPTANSNRTPDTKPDTQKISCPKSPRLLALIKKLQRDVVPGVRLIDVARDFVDGDDKKAESLLRQANRYKHLWKTGHTGR